MLDADRRRAKAEVALELRRAAQDLHDQARALEARAGVMERTWQLLPQIGPRVDERWPRSTTG